MPNITTEKSPSKMLSNRKTGDNGEKYRLTKPQLFNEYDQELTMVKGASSPIAKS